MKVVNLLEEHVEKIILAIAGLVCIWLLFTRVLFSPNVVTYRDQRFSPGEIDSYIYEQARGLEEKLSQDPEPKPGYIARLDGRIDPNDPVREGIPGVLPRGYAGLMESALNGIVDTRLHPPLPAYTTFARDTSGDYKLPAIGEVTEVAAEWIRAVAYVPTQEVTDEVRYDKVPHEPNDLDLVTVAGEFDVEALYKEFEQIYLGDDVAAELRDPCLARPVFAAVQTERQEMLEDGSWGDWQVVPRTRIDHRKRMFAVIERVEDLPPGGMKVRLLQFDDPEVRMDLLQPQPYQIASANEEWFPPSLHEKYEKQRAKDKQEEKKREMEEKAKEKEQQQPNLRGERRGGTYDARSGSARAGGTYEGYGRMDALSGGSAGSSLRARRGRAGDLRTGGRGTDMGYGTDTGYGTGRGSRTGRRPATGGRQPTDGRYPTRGTEPGPYDFGREGLMRDGTIARQPSIDDVYYEFGQIALNFRTDLAKMREPLVFWAHDDSVVPGKSYRYRIRLGVFNPTAGSKNNQVILWSEHSDITETIRIPARMYFFATDIKEDAKRVKVQVARYVLGHWYSKDFDVERGEAIGDVVESEPAKPEPIGMAGDRFGSYSTYTFRTPKDELADPEVIDYGTGAVLVDSALVNDWTGGRNLRPRNYHEMLYSFDGAYIERMPIKPMYWPTELLAASQDIKRLQREPKEPLRAWDSKVGGRARRPAGVGGYEDMEGYQEMMMMEEMMDRTGRY